MTQAKLLPSSKRKRMTCAFTLSLALLVPAMLPAQSSPAAVQPLQLDEVRVQANPAPTDAAGATRIQFDSAAPATMRTWNILAADVPNLRVGAGGANSYGDTFSLRGLSNTPYFSDPAVTLYLDDLPLGSSFTYPVNFFGFASAAVMAGPQGIAYGRAGEGGVILVRSAPPGEADGSEWRGAVGSHNARSAAVAARSARGQTADVTVSAWHNERDGYITNTQLGVRVDDRQSTGANVRLRVRPSDTGEITLQVLGQRNRDGAQPLVPLGGPYRTVARGREGHTGNDTLGVALKGALTLPAAQLTSVTSYTHWKLGPYDNRLVLPPPIDSQIKQTQDTWNEEVRLASAPDASVAWTLGGWISRSRIIGDVDRAIPGLFPIEVSHFKLTGRTLALFGKATFVPAERWEVTAGLRAERTARDFARSEQVPGSSRFLASDDTDALLPKVAVDYKIDDQVGAHASVALGAKPGGYSAFTANAKLAPFDAEKLTAFEAGIDCSPADKTLTVSLRGFLYLVRDYQIERSFTATDYLVANAPRARVRGGEAALAWRPLPGLAIDASLGLSLVTLGDFRDPFTNTSYAGNRAPYAPEYTAHLGASYRHSLGWFVAGDVGSTGQTRYDEAENPRFTQGSYALVNARAGYETARFRVTFFAENITDRNYYALIVPGVDHGALGAPRTWGVEFSGRF